MNKQEFINELEKAALVQINPDGICEFEMEDGEIEMYYDGMIWAYPTHKAVIAQSTINIVQEDGQLWRGMKDAIEAVLDGAFEEGEGLDENGDGDYLEYFHATMKMVFKEIIQEYKAELKELIEE